jgi:long-chain acyl-CoA synthetase
VIFLEKRTLGELALQAARKYGKRTAFQIYRDGGIYDRLSYAEFGVRARQLAGLLRAGGVRAGDRVMLLAENRPEWPAAWFGIILIGAAVVPVLPDFTAEAVSAIAGSAGITALCRTERLAPKAALIETGSPSPPLVIRLDAAALFETLPIPPEDEFIPGEEGRAGETTAAAVIYTSGTMGFSKGVVLSHENLIFTAEASRSLMKVYSRDRCLSVIPLAHTYELTLGLLAPVMAGASVTYLDKPPSPVVLLPAMQTLRPTCVVTVPLFIEKICRNLIFPSLLKNPLYKWPPTRLLAVRAAGARLQAALGASVRFFGIGGAPLDEDVERFLRAAGFPYSPGYGLTETSPLVAGTAPYRFPFRSAGAVVPGVEARVSAEGEIQVKGPNVMMGYYRDEERTRAAFTADGWLRTGDLGRLESARGKTNLYVRGREKALILGPSGENIYPVEIEQMLHLSSPGLVEDALVVSGERGELVALIVLGEKAQTALAALGDTIEELKNSVNKKLAAFSRLNRIEVRTEPFEKTPTQKIKRFLYSLTKKEDK